MLEPDEVAQPKYWVPPWRGPNPVRDSALVIVWIVGWLVGAAAIIASWTLLDVAPRRLEALRMLGLAAVFLSSSAGMTYRRQKGVRLMLAVWLLLMVAAAVALAKS
jgi:hypothetical protein